MTASTNPERLPAKVSPGKVIKFDEVERMSKAISPQLFGMKNSQEVCTLMMLGVADGIHPITALRRYHIIEGKPSMKSDAMLGCFLEAGGRVKWLIRTDNQVKAEFWVGEDCTPVDWTIERAKRAGLTGRKNWVTYPCQMLTARAISEGIRLAMPQIVTGIYTPEEVMDMDPRPKTPSKAQQEQDVMDVEPTPAAPQLDQEEIAGKIAHLTGWIHDVLNPTHFVRNEETKHFHRYRLQIMTDGLGLSEEDLFKLRGLAYGEWIACMIDTATEAEINKKEWQTTISKSGLSGASQMKLMELLTARTKQIHRSDHDAPEWVQTWHNRITSADKLGPAVSTFNDLVSDYLASPEPDQVEYFPGLLMTWLEHCLGLGGKVQVEKKLATKHLLPAKMLEPLLHRIKGNPS